MATEKVTTFRVTAVEDAPDFVSHGNLEAEKVDGIFETSNGRFAQHIVDSGHGVEIETFETEVDVPDAPAAEPADDTRAFDYPEDFPGREQLIANEIAFATVEGRDREELMKLKGIGPATADAIVKYVANGGTE